MPIKNKAPGGRQKGGEDVEYRSNVVRFISHADYINEEFVHLAKAHKEVFDALNKFQLSENENSLIIHV